jgi:cytochrome b involved in lipid metabolism
MPGDCYFILYGDVFDFTNYVDEHPGGPEYIEDECGTDATEMYETAKKHDLSLLQRKGGYDFYLGPACASS